jgi:putative phosphoribosyl transferase
MLAVWKLLQPNERRRNTVIFRDRADAGRQLAARLKHYANRPDVLVLALPRGGVPVAYEVAKELRAPLDIFLVRKLGVPGHEELAMGAIASGGLRVVNEDLVRYLNISDEVIDAVAADEQRELERREGAYRVDRPPPDVKGRVVILIDDGLATGSTMRAAAQALRKQQPARIVVAVPVSAAKTCDQFRGEVDEIVCAVTPEPFQGVGLWYEDFSQTTDDEVRELLERSTQQRQHAASGAP